MVRKRTYEGGRGKEKRVVGKGVTKRHEAFTNRDIG